MRSSWDFAYVIKGFGLPPVSHAVWTCGLCARVLAFKWSNRPNNPFNIMKRATEHGWSVSKNNTHLVRCPTCCAANKEKPMRATTQASTVPNPVISVTSDQRAMIRDMLDQHFQPAAGHYSVEWSDQRIGRECGVPFAVVSQMREIAYGSIRSDPETDKLRNDLAQCSTALSTILEQCVKLETQIKGLEGRIFKAEQRFKP